MNNRLVAVLVCGTAVVAIVAGMFIAGLLEAKVFAVASLAAMAITAFVCIGALNQRPDPRGAGELGDHSVARAIQPKMLVRLVVGLVLLVTSLWLTRGGPWLPRLVRATVLMLYLVGSLLARR